jgi:hypothetical protein
MANKIQPKRKGISEKVRFEVFKRDNFTCKYCGKTSGVNTILQVDHIIPVFEGGTNEIINLATSCFECNIGKGKRKLDVGQHPAILDEISIQKKKLSLKREQEKQLREYYKLLNKNDSNPIDSFLNSVLNEELNYTLTAIGMKSFHRIYDKLSLEDLRDAIQIILERNKVFNSVEDKHKYLCGILYNVHKERTDPNYQDEQTVRKYYLYHPQKRGTDYYVSWQINPLIHELGIDLAREAIDKVFVGGYKNGGYFASVVNLLTIWKNEN